MIKVILTDAMDVLFCCFADLASLLHDASGVSEKQLDARFWENIDNLWELCRANISEIEFWERFIGDVDWVDDNGNAVKPDTEELLMVFRNNMKRRVTGVFEIYQKLQNDYGLSFYMASDHVKEIVPDLVSWHPEVFEMIPEERRFWSCDLKMVKRDSEFFPFVLKVMEEKFGIHKDEILFIDDSEVNIEMARKNGIKAIRFESAEQLAKDLKAYGFEI